MADMRVRRYKVIGLVSGLGFVAFVIAGAFIWDYNQEQYRQEEMNGLAFDRLQIFFETNDAGLIDGSCIGSKETKTFHNFGSNCTRYIQSIDLKAFKDRQTAEKAGYLPCELCAR